jgi:NADPH:quinone reductase-like Zn-dependent oxidoreductase
MLNQELSERKQMKAIIWTAYGPPEVLQLQEIDKPVPGDNEVLIKIHATTVTAGDCETRILKFPFLLGLLMRLYVGIRKPENIKIIGQELAGEIEAVGKDVRLFKPGDKVFAGTGFTKGTYSEYVCLAEEPEEGVLALKPENMSYQEAAAVITGGLEALHFLRLADVQSGQKILINGAGGSIGSIAVQLAKYYGAEVTAVDSTDKLAMLSSIDADHVIDYTNEDFTRDGQIYDIIFDVVGKSNFNRSIRCLSKNGVYLIANPRLGGMLRGTWVSKTSSKKVIFQMTKQTTEDLIYIKELVEAGKIRSVIDRVYHLEETAEAHRYVETGAKKGSVVIDVIRSD